jgi:hypothetical protein
MTLGAYFDESVRETDAPEPISVAGYIFKPRGYRHFIRKWERMLESAGPEPTTHFHMTHLYARSYEYEGWKPDERAEVLRQAVDAIRKHTFCGISVLFSQTEFEQYAPPEWPIVYGSIYSVSCQVALRVTAYWMDQNNCHHPVAYVFESGNKFWDEANDVMAAIGTDDGMKREYHYQSHTAMDKLQSYGLQAADLLAWTMTRMSVGVPDNHSMRAFAPHLMRLVEGKSDRYQLFHPEGDLMRRFFQEQTRPSLIADLRKAKRMVFR